MTKSNPFDDIRALVESMPPASTDRLTAVAEAIRYSGGVLSPLGKFAPYLGVLADWQDKDRPTIERPLIAIFAALHGVSNSVFEHASPERAHRRVDNLSKGSAAIRGIATSLNAALKIYEMGLDVPSKDFTAEPSLSERECAAAIAYGMEVVAEGADIIALGSAGLGAATASAGIARALYGGAADYWAGGPLDVSEKRIDAVEKGTVTNKELLDEPLSVLRCFGGRDISGMVGAIIAARHQRIPVILDGFVTCAAAAILHELDPNAIAHCIAGHVSAEPAHDALLDRLGLIPVFDLEIGIGDGSGAGFALGGLKSACEGFATMEVK